MYGMVGRHVYPEVECDCRKTAPIELIPLRRQSSEKFLKFNISHIQLTVNNNNNNKHSGSGKILIDRSDVRSD